MAGRYRASLMYDDGFIVTPARDDNFAYPPTSPQFDLDAESSTQLFPLGTIVDEVATSRRWRYCKNGAVALATGLTVNPGAPAADHIKDLVPAAAAIGATTVTLTNGATTALTANMYAGGLLFVNAGAGLGYTYRIKSHPAAAINVTCVFTLYDPIVVALVAATSKVGLALPVYSGLILSATPPVNKVVGVPQLAVTAAYYFWCQTRGPASVLTSGTVVAGNPVATALTGGTDGAVFAPTGVATEIPIGEVINVAATTEYSLVFLKCE